MLLRSVLLVCSVLSLHGSELEEDIDAGSVIFDELMDDAPDSSNIREMLAWKKGIWDNRFFLNDRLVVSKTYKYLSGFSGLSSEKQKRFVVLFYDMLVLHVPYDVKDEKDADYWRLQCLFRLVMLQALDGMTSEERLLLCELLVGVRSVARSVFGPSHAARLSDSNLIIITQAKLNDYVSGLSLSLMTYDLLLEGTILAPFVELIDEDEVLSQLSFHEINDYISQIPESLRSKDAIMNYVKIMRENATLIVKGWVDDLNPVALSWYFDECDFYYSRNRYAD